MRAGERCAHNAPQILIGASSSSSTGWFMKTSRAPVQSPLISASVRLTCLPGRLPRTSRSLAITSSTSDVQTAAAEDEEAIGGEAERGAEAMRRALTPSSATLLRGASEARSWLQPPRKGGEEARGT